MDSGSVVTELWGRADDGVTVRILITSDAEETPGEWWPVRGLEPISAASDPETTFSVDCRTPSGWDRLESDLALFTAERLAGVVAVHAGVIRDGDTVVVLPGRSFAGKTTLCAAALDAGYEVLSDEYALVRPDGLITGYPRRLRVRLPDGLSERRPANPSPRPLEVALVAMLTYRTGGEGDSLDVEEMTSAEVALALLDNTVCAQSRPEESFRAAVAMARMARGMEGTRGEAVTALPALLEAARGEPLARHGGTNADGPVESRPSV